MLISVLNLTDKAQGENGAHRNIHTVSLRHALVTQNHLAEAR